MRWRAQVEVRGGKVQGERIDDYLDYLTHTWESLPELAVEWDTWDEESRLTWVVNWAVPEDRLSQLEQWAVAGLLTPAQRERYDMLRALTARNQTLLDRLLRD
jgi:hypothetical protein